MKDLSNENVIHIKKDGIEYLQFRKLLEYSDIISHAYAIGLDRSYTIKKETSEEKIKNSLKNYKDLCDSINVDYNNLVKPNQNHTDNIQCIDKKVLIDKPDINLENYFETDGLITNKSNLLLGTGNADCILMLFFDPVKKVIANIHSGWKGTFQKIAQKCVSKMIEGYGCDPKDIICCMTPSIRKCHFEVEKEVVQKCLQIFEYTGKIDDIIEQKSATKWNIDTILINKIILQDMGLKEENIIDSKICSVCESDQIHSYRVEGAQNYELSTAIIQMN